MQNAAPESPRFRQALSLAGLALALLAPAPPAAADDARLPGAARLPAFTPDERGHWSGVESWPVRPVVPGLGPDAGDSPGAVGLAVRLDEGLSLGAAAGFDPGSGDAVGFVSFEFSF